MPKLLLKERDIVRRIRDLGGTKLRQKGSHMTFVCQCGKHSVVVPAHGNLAFGTVNSIQRSLASCEYFGEGWLEA